MKDSDLLIIGGLALGGLLLYLMWKKSGVGQAAEALGGAIGSIAPETPSGALGGAYGGIIAGPVGYIGGQAVGDIAATATPGDQAGIVAATILGGPIGGAIATAISQKKTGAASIPATPKKTGIALIKSIPVTQPKTGTAARLPQNVKDILQKRNILIRSELVRRTTK